MLQVMNRIFTMMHQGRTVNMLQVSKECRLPEERMINQMTRQGKDLQKVAVEGMKTLTCENGSQGVYESWIESMKRSRDRLFLHELSIGFSPP